LHHAFAIILGLAGIVCFSIALVQQRPFDATLAAVVVILCWYIVHLYTERGKLHDRQLNGQPQDSVASAVEHGTSIEADGMCELDLTGYAKTLGVSLGTGTGLEEGGTLSKILLDALAKEYLRCMSALKCYQQTFGALPEDAESNEAVRPESSPRLSMRLPLDQLALDEVAVAESESGKAPTPRSPMANPPSPDPRRCRQHIEAQSSASQPRAAYTAPACPEGTSKTEGSDEGHVRTSCPSSLATSSGEARTSTEEPTPQSQPMTSTEEPAPQSQPDSEAPPPPCSFGLFGRY